MNKCSSIRYIIFVALLGFLPVKAFAATIYLDSTRTNISVGDTVIVSAKVNSDGVAANTVEGDIVIKSGASDVAVQEFTLANSAFGLWPRTPSLSSDGSTISFVGGVPGGFNIEGATLFSVIFQAKKAGTVTLSPQNIVVYANDGKGTKLPVTMKDITLTVSAAKSGTPSDDEWGTLVAEDKTPPNDFLVILGQDSTIYNGQKFAFFSAVDNQSGISYYEVSENGAPAVRSGSTYVLQDQSGDVKLTVTAYDKAGNKRVETYPAATPGGTNWPAIIAIILGLAVCWGIYKAFTKKGKKNVS